MLVHLKTNRIFSLSPTARFWDLSDGRSRRETQAELLREYDVSQDEMSAEVDSLVQTLEAEAAPRLSAACSSPSRDVRGRRSEDGLISIDTLTPLA